jgi:hypothetical protein
MANTYPDEVLGLINSLTNPRYASQDPPAQAPIKFDGVLRNSKVTFIAHRDDPHDYGVEVWEKAQAGEYGPIAPYTPPVATSSPAIPGEGFFPPPTVTPYDLTTVYFMRLMRQVMPNLTATQAVAQAAAILNGNGGKPPGGARGQAFASLAKLWGMPTDTFVMFVNALEDLRFAWIAAAAEYAQRGDAKAHQAFQTTMADAVDAFNAASPVKIKPETLS